MGIKISDADKHFSLCVRERAGWVSEYSGQGGRMECCHIYGRRSAITRWDGMNAVCLTHAEHRKFTENPADFMSWLNSYLGEGHMEILNEKRRGILKNNAATRKEVSAHYRQQHKLMLEKRADGVTGRIEFESYT